MGLDLSSTTRRTFCRLCHCACPIDAEIEHGRVVRVRGVRDNELYRGYTCSKGRAYPAMHGVWKAPPQGFDRPDAIVIVGANPLVANHMGLPCTNPGLWLKEQRSRGCQLVVIDPRRTETARQADLHLQVLPGCDAIVQAAMIRILFEEDLVDRTRR